MVRSRLCLALFLWIYTVNSMIEDFSTTVGHEIKTLHQFKYAHEGTLEMGLTLDIPKKAKKKLSETIVKEENEAEDGKSEIEERLDHVESQEMDDPPTEIIVYHCSDNQLKSFTKYHHMDDLCEDIQKIECHSSFEFTYDQIVSSFSNEVDWTYTNTGNDKWMSVVIVNCHKKDPIRVHITLAAKQKSSSSHDYLSLSELPYSSVYVFLAMVWALASAVWICHWWQYRHFNISWHKFVSIYPILNCMSCITWHFYWVYCNSNGLESFKWRLTDEITDSLADGWLFLSLMLLSNGWGLIFYQLESKWKYMEIGIIFLTYVFSAILACHFSTMITVMVFCLVLSLHRMLRGYTGLMRKLKNQRDILNVGAPHLIRNNPNAPINIKMDILMKFNRAVILWLIVEIAYQWIDTVFIEVPFMDTLLEHAIYLVFGGYIGWITRMRPFRPYFNVTAPRGVPNEYWTPLMEMPPLSKQGDNYSEWLQTSENELVIMVNDVDSDDKGSSIQTFSFLRSLGHVPFGHSKNPL